MSSRIYACGSYDEALNIIGKYVNATSEDNSEDEYYGKSTAPDDYNGEEGMGWL